MEDQTERDHFKTCNYTMDEDALDRLDAISRFRAAGCPTAPKRDKSHSVIIRDAISLLYHYEVLQQSIIHPKSR